MTFLGQIRRMQSLEYHPDLVLMMTKGTQNGVLAASFVGYVLIVGGLYKYVPLSILILWVLAQVVVLLLRIRSSRILEQKIRAKEEIKSSLKYNLFMTSLNAILWGLASWLSALYAPEAYSYFILTILLTLTSGATSTIGAVYHSYFAFTGPILFLIGTSYIYTGGEVNYLIAMVTISAMIMLMGNGYKYYQRLKRLVQLSSERKNFNEELEKRVHYEVSRNIEKDVQLMHQSRLAQMGEMIGMIAHQWRQPLHIISTAATDMDIKIQLGTFDDKVAQKNVEKINTLTQHLSETIDEFRDFFKAVKEKEETTLDSVVLSTLNIVKDYIENKKLVINTELDSNVMIQTYPNELKQVLLNLLKNAEDVLIEKNIEDAKITITTYVDEQYDYLKVCDNAGGIDDDVLPKVFDAYFTTKGENQGTGLGLYMSKRIVEEHCEGEITAYNSEEGACFLIKLPLVTRSAK